MRGLCGVYEEQMSEEAEGVHDRLSHTNINDWVHDRLSHTNIKEWGQNYTCSSTPRDV